MKQFKIRCSKIAEIMTNGRGKDTMGDTCKSYLKKWILQQIYRVDPIMSSKEMEKGIMMEMEAVKYVGEQLGWFCPEKNNQNFENDFMIGTPDVIMPDFIADIKCSWDVFTFPYFDEICPNKDYEYQIQGYMELTGKKKAYVIYVLMETPEDVPAYWTSAIPENLEELDSKLRIKQFVFEYNPVIIQAIEKRVAECRIEIENYSKFFII